MKRLFYQILLGLFWLHAGCLSAQIAPPQLVCVSNDTLIWELPTNNCGDFVGYQIFNSSSFEGPYDLLATVTDVNQDRFFHEEGAMGTWFYYMVSEFDCPNETAVPSDTLDNLIPEQSPIVAVSVEDGQVRVDWRESPSPEVIGYVILRNTSTGTTGIDTVFNDNTYLDDAASPDMQSETYFVNALDACGNSSLFDVSHSTILLNVSEVDPCIQVINLDWNLYEGWTVGIGSHEVWMSLNGGPYELIETLPGNAVSYSFENGDDGNTYCFYVRAIQQGAPDIGSNSNQICETLSIIQPVRNFVLKNASIESDSNLVIEWTWNTNAELQSYVVKSALDNRTFAELDSQMPGLPLPETLTFVDNTLTQITGPVYYRIESLDACDKADSTNVVSTIFLSGQAGDGTSNILQWIPYSNPFGRITNHEVHRVIDGQDEVIGLIPGDQNSYVDALDPNLLNSGPACYYVVAVVELSLPTGELEVVRSRSNLICIEKEALVFVPNAFVPDGTLNRQFRPVLQFGNPEQYQMLIYDRWGQEIFQSDSVEQGWDGKQDDRLLPQGVYLYYIKVVQSQGRVTERKGTVLLLR